jgi:hypothetical protein
MNMPWRNLEGPAKVLAICAVVLLVSSGLCGLQWVIYGSGRDWTALLIPFGILEFGAMIGSVVVGVVALFLWVAQRIYNSVADRNERRGKVDRPKMQTLFPREEPPDDDEKK